MLNKTYFYSCYVNLDSSEKSICYKLDGYDFHGFSSILQDFLTELESRGLDGNDILSLDLHIQRDEYIRSESPLTDAERAF